MQKSAITYFKCHERGIAVIGVPFSRREEFSKWGAYKKDLVNHDTGHTFNGWVIPVNQWSAAKEALGL